MDDIDQLRSDLELSEDKVVSLERTVKDLKEQISALKQKHKQTIYELEKRFVKKKQTDYGIFHDNPWAVNDVVQATPERAPTTTATYEVPFGIQPEAYTGTVNIEQYGGTAIANGGEVPDAQDITNAQMQYGVTGRYRG